MELQVLVTIVEIRFMEFPYRVILNMTFEGSSMAKSNTQLQLNIVFNSIASNYDLHTVLLFDEILEIDYIKNKMENVSSYASRLTDVALPVEQDFINAKYVQFGGGKISGFFNNVKTKLAAFLPRVFQAIKTYGPQAVKGINYVVQQAEKFNQTGSGVVEFKKNLQGGNFKTS